jgi:uncharacterized SAM-binding protein YcdF (DUF218 family)
VVHSFLSGTGLADMVDNRDLNRLSEFMFVADDMFLADVAIVFGMTAWHFPLEKALELYRIGLTKKLLFTGGFNPHIGTTEASVMARAAAERGVPHSDMLVDQKAANTRENVSNSYRCIKRSIGIENVKAILLVAIHYHMRRAKLTVERTFPKSIRIACASYPSAFYSHKDWHASDRGKRDVLSEALKIEKYFGCKVPGLYPVIEED